MKRLLPYLLVLVSISIAIYYMMRSSDLQSALDEKETTTNIQPVTDQQPELEIADSLLAVGNYREALNMYSSMDNTTGTDIELRRTASTALLQLQEDKNKNQAVNTQSTRSSNDEKSRVSTPEIMQYDSLSYALEKTQLQLKSIKNQLRQKAFGEYLTFKSKKGNRLHYVGQVKNKKANGQGIAILDSGSRYEGDWMDNMRHGQGIFYWIDGEHYEGSYVNDQRSGLGTYYWTNGEKYEGNWKDDQRNGRGTFYDVNEKVVTSGIWKDDKLVEED